MRKASCLVVVALVVLAGHLAYGADIGPGDKGCETLLLTFHPNVVELSPKDWNYQRTVPMIQAHFGIDSVEWCWSQPVTGSLGGVQIEGIWVACGSSDLSKVAPLFASKSAREVRSPDLYANPGIIRTKKGDIYTLSYSLSVYEGANRPWKAFGGVTWYGEGTRRFARTDGWASDRSPMIPPTLWVESEGYLCYPPTRTPTAGGDK